MKLNFSNTIASASAEMSGERLDYALLLNDKDGKEFLTDCKLSNPAANVPVTVSKGSLLKAVTLEECSDLVKMSHFPFNYKAVDNFNIKLECNLLEIKQLTYHQMQLLRAVEHIQDRCEFVHKLEWAGGLRSGTGIHITIPNRPHPVKGIIQEQLPDENGICFKVELIVS